MSKVLIENSPAEGLKEAREKMVADDAVILLIQVDEEEEGSKEKYNTSNDPSRLSTSSGLSNSKTSLEVLLVPQKPLTAASNLRLTDELGSSSSMKSQVQISTFSGHEQQSYSSERTNFSCLALDHDNLLLTTGSETGAPDADITMPKTSLVASQGATREEEDIPTDPIVARTPLLASPGSSGKEEEDDIYEFKTMTTMMRSRRSKLKFWVWIEWIAFVCITAMLISSLTIDKLEHFKILELHLWKWCVLLLVVVCGRLYTVWFIDGLVFIIERNFLLKKKLLYFVYGLKKSVRVCIWLVLVLLSWALLFNGRINKISKSTNKILNYVTRALVSFLILAVIWLIKTFLIMKLVASVNVRSFFDRILESLYHQYVIQTLSGPPSIEFEKRNIQHSMLSRRFSFLDVQKRNEGEGKEVLDWAKLHKLKQDKVSSWTMKSLSWAITTTNFFTTWDTPEEFVYYQEMDIFPNVAKSDSNYIVEDDLRRFLTREEVDNLLPQFEGAVETGRISRSMLRNWVEKAYLGRKSLASALKDAKTAVKQLNKVVSILVLVMFVIVWLISMGLATTEVLLFIASQIFIFGNTTKAVFEGIIFVFLTHPFDIGDHCVIDGVQMIVEEINIMRTGFLRSDNQMIYYPNAVLATKTIANMHTSSSNTSPFVGDAVEFIIDASTTAEGIETLKARIRGYIESKPRHWNPNHSVVVLEIAQNKMKMALYVTHTSNHQNMGEKINRRSDLILGLKRIFEELSIKYDILPREVPVSFTVQQQQQ